MNLDRAIFAFAGTMILASLALGHFVSPWWHLLTAFVGLNLLQSSFTGFCPAARLFARLGVRSGRSEEHTSELQSLMRISYAVCFLRKKKLIQALTPAID